MMECVGYCRLPMLMVPFELVEEGGGDKGGDKFKGMNSKKASLNRVGWGLEEFESGLLSPLLESDGE